MHAMIRGPVLLLAMVLMTTTTVASCSSPTAGTAVAGSAVSASGPATPEAASTDATVTATATVTVTAVTPDSPAAAIPPTDLSGQVYGFIRDVDVAKSEITLDKIDWFTGAAAQQACAADGITSTDNNWCTGYYYRNVNPALRVVAVSPDATIFTLSNGTNAVQGDLAAVAGRIATSGGQGNTYQLVVSGGVVTDLREMYHP